MARKAVKDKRDAGTRDRILKAATALSARNSTANFTLAELADRIDLHYTVLYHYFRNKSDLNAEIIEIHSQRRSERLARIRADSGSGFSHLTKFIHEEMVQEPNFLLAAQSDLFVDPYRTRINRAFGKNVKELTSVIQQGIDDGSIRACRIHMVAAMILRILNRYANQHEDVLAQAGLSASELAEQIAQFIGRGILGGGDGITTIPPAPFKPLPIPQSSDSNLDLMLRTLTAALNERGYDSTSIPDVAASIGLSKTSFYRFAASKEELLYLAAHRTLALNMQVRQVSRAVGRDPLDALLHLVFYSRYLLEHVPGPTMHPAMFHFLSEPHARAAWDIFNAGRFDIIALLEEGMEQGLFRKMDSTAVQPMLTAVMNVPLQNTDHESGVVDEATHLMLYGIANPG